MFPMYENEPSCNGSAAQNLPELDKFEMPIEESPKNKNPETAKTMAKAAVHHTEAQTTPEKAEKLKADVGDLVSYCDPKDPANGEQVFALIVESVKDAEETQKARPTAYSWANQYLAVEELPDNQEAHRKIDFREADSPLGRAALNHTEGEVVTVATPNPKFNYDIKLVHIFRKPA